MHEVHSFSLIHSLQILGHFRHALFELKYSPELQLKQWVAVDWHVTQLESHSKHILSFDIYSPLLLHDVQWVASVTHVLQFESQGKHVAWADTYSPLLHDVQWVAVVSHPWQLESQSKHVALYK